MRYAIDLNKVGLLEYRELLKTQNLLPGRRSLRDEMDARFDALLQQGLQSVGQLQAALSSARKVTQLAGSTGIPQEYLTLLRREINSLEAKPVALATFPGIADSVVQQLAQQGIADSRTYFERVPDPSEELFCLCDLVRVNGIGVAAAHAFFEAGYRSAAAIAAGKAEEMLQRLNAVNEQEHYYQAKLGIKDMQFCIDSAKLLMQYAT